MSITRRSVVVASVAAVGGLMVAGPVDAASAPRNGDLAYSITGGTVVQAPRAETYRAVADGNQAKFSPDGRRIVYTGYAGSIGYGVFVKTLPSGTPTTLGDQPVAGLAWAPDGKSVVVASGNQLQRVDASSGATTTIYTADGPVQDPAWAPDGTRIAFSTGDAIELVRPDGTGMRTLTSSPGRINNKPDWSPDSRTIAFITNRYADTPGYDRSKTELVTLPRSGRGAPVRVSHRAYPQGLFYIGVAWSPDGRKIAALQFNATHLPNDQDADERFKVRGYLPDGSHSFTLVGPIVGDDGPEGLDWAPRVS